MASETKLLVLNGCSYAETYAGGNGHQDLANRLGIESVESIAIGGSANSRILRTTAKHACSNTLPTLYVLGLTFMARWELPIAEQREGQEFEGKWINPQAQYGEQRQWNWTDEDTAKFAEINFKSILLAHDDQFEDLIYRCLSLSALIKNHGHRILFINQCDKEAANSAHNPKFLFLRQCAEFVHGLSWQAVPWQHSQGVPPIDYASFGNIAISNLPPPELAHRQPGQHDLINEFLTNYINEYRILQ